MPELCRTIGSSLLAVLLLGCADGILSQGTHTTAPASDRLEPRVALFRQQLEADRGQLRIPALSASILEDGQVLWAEGFGHADLERRVPATPDTLYHIASVTKTFTAILVLQLVEQGKLDLDAPVSRWVPEITDERVRLRHLLSHTSEGTPGEQFSYNPERFEHLKAILEQTTGKPLRLLFVETFLGPLAMRDSVPGPDVADDAQTWAVLGADNLVRYRQVLAKLAKPYTYYGDGEILHSGYPPRDFWASAGLLSTVRDLAKYDAAVDRHELLSKSTLDSAWTPVRSSAGEPLAFGTGWYVTDYRGTRLVWHFGHWGTGYSAMYLKIPARRLSLVMLTNSEALADHHYQVGQDITHNVFACAFVNAFLPELANAPTPPGDAIPADRGSTAPSTDCARSSRTALAKWIEDRHAKARTAIAVDDAVLASYAGRYQLPHRVITVTHEGGRLYIDVPIDGRSELFAETPTQFFLKIRPWTLTFVQEGGRITRLEILEAGEIVAGKRIE